MLHLVHQSATNLVHHVSLVRHVWIDAKSLEILDKLSRNLSQYFLCKHSRIMCVFLEWHKLYNVSCLVHPQTLGEEWCFISIQLLHA